MNISGSLSIKAPTIGGKAIGSYVDSDQFKSSDIIFHLQVKVANQIHEPPEYCIFNKISKVKKEEFSEMCGDCFLSGCEKGGELNAVTSIKVHDKSTIFKIKARLKAEMSTPTISGKIKANFGMEKNNLSKSTETTISVTWSGGGSIKDPTLDWGIDSLKKAAAAFPDLVAVTPQRTVGIYTNALLDHYMDSKAMWKQISHATYELKGNLATIDTGRPGEDTHALAKIKALPAAEAEAKSVKLKRASTEVTSQETTQQQALVTRQSNYVNEEDEDEKEDSIQFPVFNPAFAGLIYVRKVCRFEMAKVFNKVDLVAKNSKLATDTKRDSSFLNPLVFEQPLPVVRSLSPESARLRFKDPNAALLLGHVAPSQDDDALPPSTSSKKTIDATFRPDKIMVWSKDQAVHGIRLKYAERVEKSHGSCEGPATHYWDLASDRSQIIVEVMVRDEKRSAESAITSITLAPSGLFEASSASLQIPPPNIPLVLSCTLGIVWSKGAFVPLPAAPLSVPICKSYLSRGKKLQANVKRFKHLKNFASFPFHFILGATAAATSKNVAGGAASVDDISEPFNTLDGIDIDWVVKTIAFASNGGKLTGLKTTYTNGQEVIHGNFSREVWKCDVASPLIVAKLTAGRISEGGPGFLDAVEFIRADPASKKGEQAAWPLDVSTLRYLGEGDMRVTVDVGQVVERAPNLGGNARWTCRGFYGETKDGFISRLGIVWGRG
ncbi:hypothetical protein FMEXI_10935 [Fusarium mexicanum]|uniref:Uncharacterized protein n=1 Tax=Fusarium mexicanum TaxID=751941 RepID=A0A8H5IEZ2_9HYPO|nr:hypothetical protein FMEXI_10935 [Fusarium mexicanum]